MNQIIPPAVIDVTIGIDISKDNLDVHIHPTGCIRQFANDPAGRTALIAWISQQQPSRIVFEATGSYHRGLERALAEANLPGVKINPWQARRFAEASGRRAKTDQVDAAMLARFGATLQPEIRPARSPELDVLAELLAARRALVKDRVAAKNRAKALTLPLLERQNQERLKQIDAQIEAIDREQARLVAQQAELQARVDSLRSIPGIGLLTALCILIDMPEIGSLQSRQAASLAGLAPMTQTSGRWQGKSCIQGGRAQLRHALYMPAVAAIWKCPLFKARYEAMRKDGKPAKVAIVAIMRRMLVIANALIRDNRMWRPEQTAA